MGNKRKALYLSSWRKADLLLGGFFEDNPPFQNILSFRGGQQEALQMIQDYNSQQAYSGEPVVRYVGSCFQQHLEAGSPG